MEDATESPSTTESLQPYVPSEQPEEKSPEPRPLFASQLEGLFPLLLVAYPLTLLGLSLLVVLSLQGDIEMRMLTADPTELMGDPIYTGLLSKITILLWCAAAAFCILSWAAIPKTPANRELRSFLLFSGLFTAWLTLDDLFTIHDVIMPNNFGIPEAFYPPAYALLNLVYLLRFRKTILQTRFLPLLLAYVFFALSILIDITNASPFDNLIRDGEWLAEDGLKTLGIVSWLVYFTTVSIQAIREGPVMRET